MNCSSTNTADSVLGSNGEFEVSKYDIKHNLK